MVERIATRVAYGKTLAALGETKKFFVMDADLSGSTQTAIFGKKFPDRFINCGIAEANMISTAAGIAAAGTPVFCSSFAMFACGRAYEQIRNSVAYPRLNVKICASHGGITVGEDGPTHQYCEDLAIMRATPNMVVVNPADATETVAAIEAILELAELKKEGVIGGLWFIGMCIAFFVSQWKCRPRVFAAPIAGYFVTYLVLSLVQFHGGEALMQFVLAVSLAQPQLLFGKRETFDTPEKAPQTNP